MQSFAPLILMGYMKSFDTFILMGYMQSFDTFLCFVCVCVGGGGGGGMGYMQSFAVFILMGLTLKCFNCWPQSHEIYVIPNHQKIKSDDYHHSVAEWLLYLLSFTFIIYNVCIMSYNLAAQTIWTDMWSLMCPCGFV